MQKSENKLWSLLRPPVGPLVPYIDAFAQQLSDQGFKRFSLSRQMRMFGKFSSWLKANHIALEDVTDEHAQRFVSKNKRHTSISDGLFAGIRRLMAFLRQLEVIHEQQLIVVDATPVQIVVSAYGQHLKQGQGLSHATCVQYLPFIDQFLTKRFGNGSVDLSSLCAADVVAFIKRQAIRLSQARGKCATIALRSFLRYLRYRGEITLDLAAAVPTVPNWSMTGIPRAMPADHVRAVLASCRRDTPVGCRDYAIFMLLARLGLRSGEIVALTLESIDWDIGGITILGKGGRSSQLPLPAEVGKAIADYLQQGRPRSNCRALFLRATSPVCGLGSQTTIGSIVFAAIKRAGIETRYKGAHQFRHALACEMLRQGASMTEIGSLLRHRHAKTTGIYAKVDFVALRALSLPWPGDAQ